jgi:hypothetical protein
MPLGHRIHVQVHFHLLAAPDGGTPSGCGIQETSGRRFCSLHVTSPAARRDGRQVAQAVVPASR